MATFTYANSTRRCPVCASETNCRVSGDGLCFCRYRHEGDYSPGYAHVGESRDGLWGLWRDELDLDRGRGGRDRGGRPYRQQLAPVPIPGVARPLPAAADTGHTSPAPPKCSPYSMTARTSCRLSKEQTRDLAGQLGLPPALVAEHYRYLHDDGYGRPCWVLPEWGFDAAGRFREIAYAWRYPDGSKRTHGDPAAPVKRGLIVPEGWDQGGDLFLPEGPTDTLALHAMGLTAVGRPSSRGGADTTARFAGGCPALDARNLVVVGENDRKPDGRWEGRDGALATARAVARASGRPVRVVFPPEGCKDAREWFRARWKPGTDPALLRPQFLADFMALVQVVRPEEGEGPNAGRGSPQDELEDMRFLIEEARQALGPAAQQYSQQAEQAAARAVAALRADQQQHPCSCPRYLFLGRRQDWQPCCGRFRCEHRDSCPGCRCYLIEREMVSAELHFAQTQVLYRLEVFEEGWQRTHRVLNREGGEYLRLADRPLQTVFSDVWVPGAFVTDRGSALEEVRARLEDWEGAGRPVTTSHGWALPQEEGAGDYVLLADAGCSLDPEDVLEAAREFGATVEDGRGRRRGGMGRILGWCSFDRPGGWDEGSARRFVSRVTDREFGELPPGVTLRLGGGAGKTKGAEGAGEAGGIADSWDGVDPWPEPPV